MGCEQHFKKRECLLVVNLFIGYSLGNLIYQLISPHGYTSKYISPDITKHAHVNIIQQLHFHITNILTHWVPFLYQLIFLHWNHYTPLF